jgi:hypothetical protein
MESGLEKHLGDPPENENMPTICKNCNHQFNGNFCNLCGQAANTHELSTHFIWHDLQHGLFHFDNGIFYTIRQLLTRPGHTIKEFINGKRVRHFKPLSLVIVLAALYGLLYHYSIGDVFSVEPTVEGESVIGIYEKFIRWLTDHFAYAALIIILSATISSYLIFKKQGFNLVEHFVLNTYYMGLLMVIALFLLPVLYLSQKKGHESAIIYTVISQLIYFGLMYWCYAQFFNKLAKLKLLGLTALNFLFMSMIATTIGYLAAEIIGALE